MSKGPKARPLFIPPAIRGDIGFYAHRTKASHALVQRARIISFSAKGMGTAEGARRVGCSESTVRKWKRRIREKPTIQTVQDA